MNKILTDKLKRATQFACVSVAAIACLTGCASNMKAPKSFMTEGGSIALIWSSELPHGISRRSGPQGLLDIVINEALKGSLGDYVETIQIAPLANHYYLEPYGKKLQKEGFDVNVVKLPVERASLREKKGKGRKKFRLNLTEFGKTHHVKYALYLHVKRFGTVQNYSGFIAISGPMGTTDIEMTLVDTEDNTVLGSFTTSILNEVEGNWDVPPTYSAMTDSIIESFEKALKDAYFGMFEAGDYDDFLNGDYSIGGGL